MNTELKLAAETARAFERVMQRVGTNPSEALALPEFRQLGPQMRAVVNKQISDLQPVHHQGGWYPLIREPSAGAWQRNDELRVENILQHPAVFACTTLIATDMGKMGIDLAREDDEGIWKRTHNPAWSPVLETPNHYQIRQKFVEQWMLSKLIHGNTYVLKRRDGRGVVNALYVLDPSRVRPMLSPEGSVFYELKTDHLNQLGQDTVLVPAREIIHDTYVTFFHPLVGVSPLFASGLAAGQGLKIQSMSAIFFANGAQPGGVLTAPASISDATAKRAKEYWESEFGGGNNAGKVAVLGDGLHYEPMMVKAVDAQLIEQLKWTAEAVCMAYRIPSHKIIPGQVPNYNNIETLEIQYLNNCLWEKVKAFQSLLAKGLDLPYPYSIKFNLDDLVRMDQATLIKSEKDANGLKTVNESRRRINLPGVDGGNTVYRQQQDYSIEALNRRDQEMPPPVTPGFVPDDDVQRDIALWHQKAASVLHA